MDGEGLVKILAVDEFTGIGGAELQASPAPNECVVGSDDRAHSAAVDPRDVLQVEHHASLAQIRQFLQFVVERLELGLTGQLPVQREHGNQVDAALDDLHGPAPDGVGLGGRACPRQEGHEHDDGSHTNDRAKPFRCTVHDRISGQMEGGARRGRPTRTAKRVRTSLRGNGGDARRAAPTVPSTPALMERAP